MDRYKVQIENFAKESSTIPNLDCHTSELMLKNDQLMDEISIQDAMINHLESKLIHREILG